MNKKTKLISTAFFCLALFKANSQEAFLTSGIESSGSGGISSSSIGQVFYTTSEGVSGTVLQGVQLAFEISTTSGIEETGISLNCSVYPNPTVDYLTLTIVNNLNPNLSYHLLDFNGKVITSNSISSENTIIVMNDLPNATYFLKVAQDNLDMKIFKIIKNQ